MLYIGAGGWAYFRVPGMDPLSAYSAAFNFVEVNSTFYAFPSTWTVRSWRRRVPPDFVFSVRCHRDLTHKYMLSPNQESCDVLSHSLRICNELGAKILLIQTPPGFNPDERLKDIRDLFSSFDSAHVRLVWEIRGQFSQPTVDLMRDLGIIHCTDISREFPASDSDIIYTRLFGHGEHNLYQFDDAELMAIHERVKSRKKAYLTFHGSKMYKDAARLRVYEEYRTFPHVTNSIGPESLRIVLEEDAKFPATRRELIKSQGWKVIDLNENERVHASTLLKRLAERKYLSVGDVMEEIYQL
ncbi:MAG TPA: DUF72 domain-containing protein [Candidatus Methanoperedens sp.]